MAKSFFGANLKRIRTEKGMTQQQLADLIMTTHSTISDWERDISYPQAIWIYEIADKLHIPPESLISEIP